MTILLKIENINSKEELIKSLGTAGLSDNAIQSYSIVVTNYPAELMIYANQFSADFMYNETTYKVRGINTWARNPLCHCPNVFNL